MKKSRGNIIQRTFKRLSERIDLFSLVIGVVIGLLISSFLTYVTVDSSGFFQNLVPEAVGLIFTVLILDNLANAREERSTIEQLIRRMHSRYNHTAREAIEELRVIGRLADGTLQNHELRGSNWEDANLYEADLSGCDLTNAILYKADLVKSNLTGAMVTDEQLAATETMAQATLPDGTRYDGRFNLVGDFAWAKRKNVDLNSPEAMADFYGIPVQQYLRGQNWWNENKSRFKKRSRHYDETSEGNQAV